MQTHAPATPRFLSSGTTSAWTGRRIRRCAWTRRCAKRALREFWARHPDAEPALAAWFHDTARATWSSPVDVRKRYATASIVGDNRVVFNIRGNRYRIVVAVNYAYGIVNIRFVGTHNAYDEIDVSTI